MGKCRKCYAALPEGAKFCPRCGVRQDISHNTKSRGNGQGSVYQLENKTWCCVVTVGYELDEDGAKKRKTRVKKGFRTKKEAIDYIPMMSRE